MNTSKRLNKIIKKNNIILLSDENIIMFDERLFQYGKINVFQNNFILITSRKFYIFKTSLANNIIRFLLPFVPNAWRLKEEISLLDISKIVKTRAGLNDNALKIINNNDLSLTLAFPDNYEEQILRSLSLSFEYLGKKIEKYSDGIVIK